MRSIDTFRAANEFSKGPIAAAFASMLQLT